MNASKFLLLFVSSVLVLSIRCNCNSIDECLNSRSISFATSDDVDFDKQFQQFWTSGTLHRPQAIISVRNAFDVQQTIECAKRHEIHLAIRSGGHCFASFSLGCNHSWVIDLKLLNEIKFNSNTKTVTAGAGVTVGKLEEALWTEGYFVPGGTEETVGASGISLGGGLGYFTREYGVLTDYIKEVEIVTADGKIRTASENSENDLFWALRGAGGGNFGVVTKITFRVETPPKFIVTISKHYDKIHTATIFNIWQKYFASQEADRSLSTSIDVEFMGIPGVKLLIVISTNTETRRNFLVESMKNVFPDITNENVKEYKSYFDLISEFGRVLQPFRSFLPLCMIAMNFLVSKQLTSEDANKVSELLVKSTNSNVGFLINTLSDVRNEVSRNTTAWVHRDSYYNVLLGSPICEDGTDSKVRSAFEQFYFIDNGESYQNLPSKLHTDYLRRYYAENLERLMQVKNKYDPDNFFCFPQSIPLELNSSSKECSCNNDSRKVSKKDGEIKEEL